MNQLSLHLRRPTAAVLDHELRRAAAADLTYDFVGTTLTSNSARTMRRRTVELGVGSFDRGVDGIRRWVCHTGIGASVHPDDPSIEVGQTLVVALPVGPLTVLAPTRIVAVVDEPDRFGFAYGTLPTHPERGEESFLLERRPDGQVTFTIAVAASPIPLLRALTPVILLAQRRALRGYLRAMQRHVGVSGGSARLT